MELKSFLKKGRNKFAKKIVLIKKYKWEYKSKFHKNNATLL